MELTDKGTEKVITEIFITIRTNKMKRKIQKGDSAFTIAEVLLVVVLIVLIAGAAGGIYVGTYKKALVEKAARDFLLAAKYARISAIEQQTRCMMKLDAVNNGFLLLRDEINEETEETEQMVIRDVYFKPVQFGDGVNFEKISIEPAESEQTVEPEMQNVIAFSSDGTAQAAVIQIGNGKTHYTAQISGVTGRTKIYEGTVENITADTIDLDKERQ